MRVDRRDCKVIYFLKGSATGVCIHGWLTVPHHDQLESTWISVHLFDGKSPVPEVTPHLKHL